MQFRALGMRAPELNRSRYSLWEPPPACYQFEMEKKPEGETSSEERNINARGSLTTGNGSGKRGETKSITKGIIWQYAKPHASMLVFALVLNSLSGLAMTVQTMAPKYLIDDVILAPSLTNAQRYTRLTWLALAYLFVSVVWRMLGWHVSFRIFTRIREEIIRSIRSALFRHINTLCLRFHLKNNSGELFSYLFGTPLTQVQQFFQQASMMGPHYGFMVISTLAWVFFWDPVLTTVLMLSVVGSVMAMNQIRVGLKTLHEVFQDSEKIVSGKVADLVRGSRAIKLHSIEEQIIEEFNEQAQTIGERGVERDIRSHMLWMRQETVSYLGFTALSIACTWRFLEGNVTIGEVTAYLGAFIGLQGPLNTLSQIASSQGAAQASLERIAAVLDTTSTTPEPTELQRKNLPTTGAISFRHVRFAYAEETVLDDFSLEIPYGQKIALVGPSGSGKSTLSQLAMRLYDPQEGQVCLGGVNLRNCTGRDVRRQFGVVPQDPYFFQTSILENVRLLEPDATPSEVRAALEKANAWEFVRELPQQLDTMIGESGANLSGGQKQRLAIARALLIDPPCFIFDEATSALDTVSERLIQEALEKILKDKTAIFIAHRLSTIQTCDRILVLRKGKIIQDGSYSFLASTPGLFQEMVRGAGSPGEYS
jgi:subfamily B ATP-binding cassette protein MsbA